MQIANALSFIISRANTNAMTQSIAFKTAAIILAAGRGTRAGGDVPKQYRLLAGRPVLDHARAAFATHPAICQVIIVRHRDDTAYYADTASRSCINVFGGPTREASVKAGLSAIMEGVDHVLIHDGARPLVSRAVIDGVLHALQNAPAAAPALAVTDALWRGAGHVENTVERANLWRAQTPQGFHLAAIRAAHAQYGGKGAKDDVEIARAAGLSVAITQGDENNLKLTHAGDFTRAEHILRGHMDIRTGNGFDVHRFGPGDHVMLCGVNIPHTRGLQGHSDADVGMHALTDAIYGALAQGDIGQHFPPSDPQWKGAESHVFLTHAVELATAKGFGITHVDVTLICEYPKIGPHCADMRACLARLLQIDIARVSVKATTSERLGFTGRQEGIAAMASATLVAP